MTEKGTVNPFVSADVGRAASEESDWQHGHPAARAGRGRPAAQAGVEGLSAGC